MSTVDVSVIIPVHNGEQWLGECLQSVLEQQFNGSLEVSIYDDASTDNTKVIIDTFCDKIKPSPHIFFTIGRHVGQDPLGVGFAKNRAVLQSRGMYLCFQDADDVMLPDRIQMQWECCKLHPNAIVGSRFTRLPANSTLRFTKWANNLTPFQLYTQIYTSHGPTLIMPTWFCHRHVFERIGGFLEEGKGNPEDLIFFYAHLNRGGTLHRVDKELVIYRYHQAAMTFSVPQETIWNLRINRFQEKVLPEWKQFMIWNAGKQGRRFYRFLSSENRSKVSAFCDVDEKKIHKGCYVFESSQEIPKPCIPIIHFSKIQPPFVICVKMDLTKGQFEENLASLGLTEGTHYYHFN